MGDGERAPPLSREDAEWVREPRTQGKRWPGSGWGAQGVGSQDFTPGTWGGEGRLRQGEEPPPASCCRGSLPSRLRYKTPGPHNRRSPGGLPGAPSSAWRRLGSSARCGCCRRSWPSPLPGPWPAQVNALPALTPGRSLVGGPSASPAPRTPPRLRGRAVRAHGLRGGPGASARAAERGRADAVRSSGAHCRPRAVRPRARRVCESGLRMLLRPASVPRPAEFHAVSALSAWPWVAVPPAGALCWVAAPAEQGQQVGCGGASHPRFLPRFSRPGGCQLPSSSQPPALYWEPGGGHPRTKVPAEPVFPARVIFV